MVYALSSFLTTNKLTYKATSFESQKVHKYKCYGISHYWPRTHSCLVTVLAIAIKCNNLQNGVVMDTWVTIGQKTSRYITFTIAIILALITSIFITVIKIPKK